MLVCGVTARDSMLLFMQDARKYLFLVFIFKNDVVKYLFPVFIFKNDMLKKVETFETNEPPVTYNPTLAVGTPLNVHSPL